MSYLPRPGLTEDQMKLLMLENLRAALATCHGKVYGPDGAARLLGMKPTTLSARLRKLGLQGLGS